MIGTCGCFALSAATIRRVGATTQVSNSRGGRLPAQVSKICSTSAPASACIDR